MSKGKSKKFGDENIDSVVTELSESAYFQQPAKPQEDKPTKPQVDKYTTHLRPGTIKAIKRYAFEHEMKDYEVVQLALDHFLVKKDE